MYLTGSSSAQLGLGVVDEAHPIFGHLHFQFPIALRLDDGHQYVALLHRTADQHRRAPARWSTWPSIGLVTVSCSFLYSSSFNCSR